MSGYHYQISEASRLLAVEAHVLRYWEEELGMIIPRNEMGHRYYTEEHLRIFSQIKDMKERGYQLRAIRAILSGEEPPEPVFTEIPLKKETGEQNRELRGEHLDSPGQAVVVSPGKNSDPVKIPKTAPEPVPKAVPEPDPLPPAEIPSPDDTPGAETKPRNPDVIPADRKIPDEADTPETRMDRFQAVMTRIVAQAMLCNNPGLIRAVSRQLEEDLLPEIERLMDSSESRQEERFRRLDESMRAIQQGNRARYEAAAARSSGLFGRRKRRKRYRRI